MTHLHFSLGNDVFVRDPGSIIPDVISITGVIDEIDENGPVVLYMFNASVCRKGSCVTNRMAMPASKLGIRVGTPLSELDGRNGGNAEWRRISESWGY